MPFLIFNLKKGMVYNMTPYVIMASTMVVPGVVILLILRWFGRRRMRMKRRYR